MTRNLFAAIATIFLAATAAAPSAHAGVCDDATGGLMMGPVSNSLQMGDLGAPRRACARTTVYAGASGGAIVEPENFYGNIAGSLAIGGSYAFGRHLEIYGSVEPLLFQQLISAFTASHVGLGHTSLGATWTFLHTSSFAMATTSRLTLPTAVGLYNNAWPVGLDAGVTFTLAPLSFLRLYGEAGGLGRVMLTAGDPFPRAGLVGVLGNELVLWDWASFVVEAKALALYEADLDHVSMTAALRARIWGGLAAEAYVAMPIAGRERTLASGGLRLGYRFD